eukprot:10877728-Lingulodinium_polyedra.AAC.1
MRVLPEGPRRAGLEVHQPSALRVPGVPWLHALPHAGDVQCAGQEQVPGQAEERRVGLRGA